MRYRLFFLCAKLKGEMPMTDQNNGGFATLKHWLKGATSLSGDDYHTDIIAFLLRNCF